mgnify:FL=1
MLDRLLGVDEQSLAYDLSRAHSADVFFLKLRAWLWGIITGVTCFLFGNILGHFGLDLVRMTINSFKDIFGWV